MASQGDPDLRAAGVGKSRWDSEEPPHAVLIWGESVPVWGLGFPRFYHVLKILVKV